MSSSDKSNEAKGNAEARAATASAPTGQPKTAYDQFNQDAKADERAAEGKDPTGKQVARTSMATPAFDTDYGSDGISHRTPTADKPADAGAVFATDEEWEEKQGGVEGGTIVAPVEATPTK